jgi:hypothetical protein
MEVFMRAQNEIEKNTDNIRSNIHFLVGLFMGIGFGAVLVFFLFVHHGSSFGRKVGSTNDETIIPTKNCLSSSHPMESSSVSFDRAAIEKAILTAGMAVRDAEEGNDKSSDSKGLRQKDEERMSEMRTLRQALPGNGLLPVNKTEEERQQERENSRDEMNIRELIIGGRALKSDLADYYDLKAKRFNDEIALLDFCDNNLNEAKVNGNVPLSYCIDVEATGIADRRKANEDALARLQQDYQNGFPHERKSHELQVRLTSTQTSVRADNLKNE